MPQFLIITIDGNYLAHMKTGNLGGTRYNIDWFPKLNICEHNFLNIDTGIERQPSHPYEKTEDFKNDFIHASRAIAAAEKTAKKYLYCLENQLQLANPSELSEAHIFLRTNIFDRGRIIISPIDVERANLTIEIGTGPVRPQYAKPIKLKSFSKKVNLSRIDSTISMTSNIFESEAQWILHILSDESKNSYYQ